jgi:hypothetical protein
MDTNRSEKPLARIITIVLNAAKHLHPPLACALTYYDMLHAGKAQAI